MASASLLIGGFYPLTQVYQHTDDLRDGVKTISYLLGYRGTFLFSALMYTLAFTALGLYFSRASRIKEFLVLATFMLPIAVYFIIWASRVWKDQREANFTNTMRMNILASTCVNLGFIIVTLM